MRLRAAVLWLALVPGAALAQTATAPVVPVTPSPQPGSPPAAAPPPPDVWQPRPMADVQALDKITARVTTLTLRVGQPATFGSLNITVRACVVRPPDQAADTAMFFDITDQHPGAPEFHGWMIMSSPGASLLQHPVYDIRPLACHA